MARFCPLFSGSSGNSYYIGSARRGILIDAGRSARQITEMLKNCGIDLSAICALFVTHEHSDHVAGLRVLASKNHFPVYASYGTLRELEKMGCLSGNFSANVIETNGVECAGMRIRPFPISHDSAECVGYRIETEDGRIAALSTDLGCLSNEVHCSLSGADLVVMESNHDVGMLENGPYPYPLKRRILSDKGHLSNNACAEELDRLAHERASHFILAHLSRENNTPDLAYQTTFCKLTMSGMKQGRDYKLTVAPRENSAGNIVIF